MIDQPEKLDLASMDMAAEQKAKLKELFPEVFTEGGKIDFERLKRTLGESLDVGKERYGMNWPGKADCFKTIQTPSAGTLVPDREGSVEFDSTENLILEGDNLEVLKLLQKAYLGKVKMIYIDPPYNTGNDFIYPDNYSESLQTYLEYTGQVDGEGRKYSTNTEADGRFHSKWMNMMYPRLFLARNLLRDNGVIFISIDDHEVDNLKKICNEVFGEENFLASITWQKKYSPANDTVDFSASHDFILAYAKARPIGLDGKIKASLLREERSEEMDRAYSNPDNDARGPWKPGDYTCNKSAEERPRLYYSIEQPNTGENIWPKKTRVWAYNQDAHEKNIKDNRVWWGGDGHNKVPSYKRFLTEVEGVVPQTVWLWDEVGHTDEAKKEVQNLFHDAANIFETPKPTKLIQKMLCLGTRVDQGDIIVDFFSGSATTAHSVLAQNQQDRGNRKFILVQLPEPTAQKDFPTIAEITKERVRRVIQKLSAEDEGKLPLEGKAKPDRGFKVFKLRGSNFKAWNGGQPESPEKLSQQLELHVDHLVPGRSQEDILFELLLKSGFPLATKVESLTLAGKTVFSIAEGSMLICLEPELTPDVIKAMADRTPQRVVCLDAGFAQNDQLKTNAVQTMKARGVVKFQTV